MGCQLRILGDSSSLILEVLIYMESLYLVRFAYVGPNMAVSTRTVHHGHLCMCPDRLVQAETKWSWSTCDNLLAYVTWPGICYHKIYL